MHLLFAVFFFLDISRLDSIRPLDHGATDAVAMQQARRNVSLVEVGARHFAHASKPLEKEPASTGSLVNQPSESDEAVVDPTDAPAASGEDEASLAAAPATADDPNESGLEASGEDELSLAAAPATADDPNESGLEAAPAAASSKAAHSLAAVSGSSVQGENMDTKGADMEADMDPEGREDMEADMQADIPQKGAEKSHKEANMDPDASKTDMRGNHFRELLDFKPKLLGAVDKYEDNVGRVKKRGHDVVDKLDTALHSYNGLMDNIGGVQDELARTRHAVFSETRDKAIDTVKDFETHNKEGPAGDDKDGKWVPEVGQWSIFRNMLFPGGKRRQGI